MIDEIKSGVFTVGANHWNRQLFDELIHLPNGTTYNAYFIKGKDKNVLIDTVDPDKKGILIDNLEKLKVDKLDYIISNHAEQDHSGTIPDLLKLYPDVKIVTNPKCKDFLKEHLLISDNKFHVVNDGETLSIGDKTFQFILTPWVHWPETMVTYLKEDKILFSCDFFGSHLASSDTYALDESKVYSAAKRYYAEIMMPFKNHIIKHLEKVDQLKINIIAPSHGPLYNKPEFIINAYKEWVSDKVQNEVVIPYVSMHDSTQKMVDYLVDSLAEKGLSVKPFNLTVADMGEFAMSLIDAATVIIATPTVLAGPHPSAVYASYFMNALRPKTKFVSVIGSYGWGGKTLDVVKNLISNVKAEFITPVIIKGHPKEQDYKLLEQLSDTIFNKHKELHLI